MSSQASSMISKSDVILTDTQCQAISSAGKEKQSGSDGLASASKDRIDASGYKLTDFVVASLSPEEHMFEDDDNLVIAESLDSEAVDAAEIASSTSDDMEIAAQIHIVGDHGLVFDGTTRRSTRKSLKTNYWMHPDHAAVFLESDEQKQAVRQAFAADDDADAIDDLHVSMSADSDSDYDPLEFS